MQTWLDYLVPELDALGWHVTVLLVHGVRCDGHRYLQSHPFPNVRLVSNPSGSREGRIRALRAAIREVQPELVLCVNIVDVYEAVSRERSTAVDAPRVVTALHALSACFYQDLIQWSGVIDGVIATNRLAAAAAVNWCGMANERVHYAPCGVEVPDLIQPESTSDQLPLLYAGRFDADEKRVLDLPCILRALERRKLKFRLQLAGAGPAERALRLELSEFGSRIEFLGEVGSETLQTSFFRPDAIALVLSPRETGPLVAFEAMAQGVAVVTSRYLGIGLEGSLRHGENCLVFETGDVEAAAEAVASMADVNTRRSLARAGHDMVDRRYSRQASVAAWDRALRDVRACTPLAQPPGRIEAPPSGRFDRYLGVGMAEHVRQLFRVSFPHVAPGDEWPHSYGRNLDAGFADQLVALDQASGQCAMVEVRS